MSAEIVIALIALATSVLSALLAALLGLRSQVRLQQLMRAMDEQQRQREVVDRYREPLVRAAHGLQSRLWNIGQEGFLQRYYGHYGREPVPPEQLQDQSTSSYAVDSTLWLTAQYLCWTEILRREAQFLRLDSDDDTVRLQALLDEISHAFGTDSLDAPLRLFRSEQAAIGELMIAPGVDASGGARTGCLGYATFTERLQDPSFGQWFRSLQKDVAVLAQRQGRSQRLVRLQHRLIDLIDLVDPPPGVRFTRERDLLNLPA